MNEIAKNVRAYVVENFLFGDDNDLSNDDSFLEKGILDSTGVLLLVDHLEDTFSIDVGHDEITPDNLDSINQIADYVDRKQKQHSNQPAKP